MLVAFGGVYPWTYVPAAIVLAAAFATAPPAIGRRGTRVLDVSLACCIGVALLQLVPLPLGLRSTLSPSLAGIDQALRVGDAAGGRTLSIDPAGTLDALMIASMDLAMFWIARGVCARQGARTLVRTVAWTGLVMAVAAIVFATSSPSLIYGLWFPHERARPYGPFVNRNHMGTWLIMALLMTAGYVFARFQSRGRVTLAAAVDARMIWLIGSAASMLVAVIVSLSRSATVGTIAGALLLRAVAARHGGRALLGLLAAGAAALLIVTTNPRTADLSRRFEQPGTTAAWTREQIWRETIPIVRDFPLTGTGVGTYPTAMLVYQQSDRTLFFNQAHNQYLQLAAEGGLLLVLPLAVAAAAFARRAARRLARDRSAMFWIRAGAAAGMVGVLVQSLWETGLRLPANGLLFAALAAVAVHDDDPAGAPEDHHR
jgi:O-antigen ligase